MTFFVHGLSGHETMPMNRLFKKRPVNKTDAVYAYHGVDARHVDNAEESMHQHHSHSDMARESYRQIEHEPDNDSIVLAKEIMISPVMVLPETAMISDALDLFHKRQFRHVPVLSERTELIGMLSDRDVLRYLGDTSVQKKDEPHTQFNRITNVMTTDVVSASSDTDVRYIARLFVEGRIGAMPIVDNGKLTGVLTRSDILRAIMNNFHIGLWV